MKSEFIQYLESLGMRDPTLERAEAILKSVEDLGLEVEDIFACEYLDSGGNRIFEFLCLFTEKEVIFGDVRNPDSFTCITISKQLRRWGIEKKNYDLRQAQFESRFTVSFAAGDYDQKMWASRQNCDKLLDVFRQRILPNMAAM